MEETFNIPLRSLPEGDSSYDFHVGKGLFASIENALVDDGDLTAHVGLHKTAQMVAMDISIEGVVRTQCDICLGDMDYAVEDCGGRITLRLGDHFEEVNEELYEVDENEEELDLSQWIYEFICVSLPIRFEHPLDEDGNPTCDPEMLAELDKYLVKEGEEPEAAPSRDGQTDPRWDALKGLLGKEEDK